MWLSESGPYILVSFDPFNLFIMNLFWNEGGCLDELVQTVFALVTKKVKAYIF